MTLAEYITSNLKREFEWGNFDCVLFAAGWVTHATGGDPLADVKKWKSERQALRGIKAVGGLEKALDERFTRINPNFAKDGDLALYKGAVCIFSGPHIVGPNKNGLEFINRMEAECAWSF